MTPLSPRESQIVACLQQGLTYKEIAKALGISKGTVKSYVWRARCKMKVPTNEALIYLVTQIQIAPTVDHIVT